VEAAFFDLDKTVIAKASIAASGVRSGAGASSTAASSPGR